MYEEPTYLGIHYFHIVKVTQSQSTVRIQYLLFNFVCNTGLVEYIGDLYYEKIPHFYSINKKLVE